MKYLISTLFSICLFSNAFSQGEKTDGAFLSLETDTINFGELTKSDGASKKIKVTNTGSKPLIINDCKGSCGCTVPKCPTKSILPGEVDYITVSYDNKSNSGPFKKTVTIKSNAVNRVVYIKVIGNVIE